MNCVADLNQTLHVASAEVVMNLKQRRAWSAMISPLMDGLFGVTSIYRDSAKIKQIILIYML